jgi:hypothetical protein
VGTAGSGKRGKGARLDCVPTISEENVPLVLKAIEHYSAYLKATNRDAGPYERIAEGLTRKQPGREEEAKPKTQKRA